MDEDHEAVHGPTDHKYASPNIIRCPSAGLGEYYNRKSTNGEEISVVRINKPNLDLSRRRSTRDKAPVQHPPFTSQIVRKKELTLTVRLGAFLDEMHRIL